MHKIIWTDLAEQSLRILIQQLTDTWGDKISNQFLDLIDTRLNQLQQNPRLAPKRYNKHRRLVIHKHVSLFYIDNKDSIIVTLIWDNRQNPDTLEATLTGK